MASERQRWNKTTAAAMSAPTKNSDHASALSASSNDSSAAFIKCLNFIGNV